MSKVIKSIVGIGLLLMGAGCASNLPREISSAPIPDINLTTVQKDAKSNKGTLVRWGGIIIGVQNLKEKSVFEVLAKPLNTYGQPALNTTSPGRFFAEVKGFADPSFHAPGKEITFFGTVTGLRASKIGEHEYHYPVISASLFHAWRESSRYRYDPYWDDDRWGYHGPWLWYSWGHHSHHGHHHPHH